MLLIQPAFFKETINAYDEKHRDTKKLQFEITKIAFKYYITDGKDKGLQYKKL